MLGRGADSPPIYEVGWLERWPLGTKYGAVCDRVAELYGHPDVRESHRVLLVDGTGVGAGVVEMLEERGLEPVTVVITAGRQVAGPDRDRKDPVWKVPKRDLVAALQVVLQSSRLAISPRLALAPTLSKELGDFRVKVRESSRGVTDSYEAWREADHDDLVLAAAIGVWYAERVETRVTTGARRPPAEEARPIAVMRRRT